MFTFFVVLAFVALLLLLPLTTSMRLLRISRELEELRSRMAELEATITALGATRMPANSVETAPAPAPPATPESVGETSGPTAADAFPPAEIIPAGVMVSALAPAVSHGSSVEPPLVPAVASESPAAAGVDADDLDLEGRIGGRWLLYTGVLVLLLGVSFFLKYAFDSQWITETGRVVIGAIGGLALIAGGLRLVGGGLAVFGQALVGTGLAVLYLAVYAALAFYGLIDRAVAFALMLAVTVLAAVLADRQRAQALAFIAVGGGFVTPFLVGSGEDAQLTLFTYTALLVAGTMILAFRHDWLGLNAISYALTYLTITAWAARFYTDEKWLRTFLFLTLFCVMFVQILRATRRVPGGLAQLVAWFLSTGPFVYHIAAIVLTARHPPAIHVYIIAFTAVGLWLTAEPHRSGWRLLVLVGSYVPLFGSLTLPDGLSWLTPNVVTIVAVAALHTMALLDRVLRQEERLETADLVSLHITGLGLFGLLYRTLQPSYPDFRGGLAALVAFGALALWRVFRGRDRVAALNALALAFTAAAIGIAVQFDGPVVVIGWAAEGAAVTWVGLRVPSLAFQAGGLTLWGFAAARLLERYFDTPAGFTAIFNVRSVSTFFVVAIAYGLAWLFTRHGESGLEARRTRAVLHVVASVLTLVWITAEIDSYWDVRPDTPQADLSKQMLFSLAWGVYGAVLIVDGMRRRYAPDRYIGIAVIALTVLKVFFSDLWQLGGIYRVVGFIGCGVVLMLVSYLYHRTRRGKGDSNNDPQ